MMRLDTHQHFWKYSPEEYGWIGPEMSFLRRDFLPGELAPEMERYGWEGGIAVQARQTEAETAWLLELAEHHPLIAGVVGWLDLRSPDLGRSLEQWGGHRRLCGLRHIAQDEAPGFLLRSDFQRGIGQLAAWGLSYDLLVYAPQLSEAAELARRFPSQAFVLDHLGKPDIRGGGWQAWREALLPFGELEHVCAKLSGLLTQADWGIWRPADFHPYLETALEVFGPRRLMMGSDWPLCLLSASYPEAMNIVSAFISRLSAREQALILGGTGEAFYLKKHSQSIEKQD
jgi:L-fuconolactonase